MHPSLPLFIYSGHTFLDEVVFSDLAYNGLTGSQPDLLLAVGALELLLEPAVDATRVENVAALQGFHLGARPQHFKANRATDLFLLPLDFFALALRETVLLLQ